jgi:hypothetical protein
MWLMVFIASGDSLYLRLLKPQNFQALIGTISKYSLMPKKAEYV